MIKLTNVSKEYAKGGFALRDVSLHVKKGEFVFLTGHSGAGKSTTMRLSHMAERPTSGEVRVTGYTSDRITQRALWKIRRRVGFVFQDFRLLPGRTALENVSFVLEVTGTARKQITPRAQRLLAQVCLAIKAGQLVHELSGGEQQLLLIGRAMMAKPKIIAIDEPSLGLAPMMIRDVYAVLRQLKSEGTTFFLVEQNSAAALSIADYAYVMENGRIVMDGPADKLADNEDIKEFYLGVTASGERKSYRDIKHYRRRKRWLG